MTAACGCPCGMCADGYHIFCNRHGAVEIIDSVNAALKVRGLQFEDCSVPSADFALFKLVEIAPCP